MATFTAQSVIDEFRGNYYTEISATGATNLFNKAYKRHVRELNLRTVEGFIPLAAATRTYAISEEVLRVYECYLDTSSTNDGLPLIPTTRNFLFHDNPYFLDETGLPTHFYFEDSLSGNTSVPKICFYPTPISSADPTYPRVRWEGSLHQTLSGSDVVPSAIFDELSLVYMMCYLWAVSNDPTKMKYWEGLYREELQREDANVNAKIEGMQIMQLSPVIYLARRNR
jgi:hypothetical protein